MVLPVYQMAKRSRPFTDEASKLTVASLSQRPQADEQSRAVRQDKSSPLITAQEKTQSDVKGQVNPKPGIGRPIAFARCRRHR